MTGNWALVGIAGVLLLFLFYYGTKITILQSITNTTSGSSCDNNANCTITGKINTSIDANFHSNVKTDGNYYGQLISPGSAIGTSCNTICANVVYAGPYTCVEADSLAGILSTCTDITIARTCICRN